MITSYLICMIFEIIYAEKYQLNFINIVILFKSSITESQKQLSTPTVNAIALFRPIVGYRFHRGSDVVRFLLFLKTFL